MFCFLFLNPGGNRVKPGISTSWCDISTWAGPIRKIGSGPHANNQQETKDQHQPFVRLTLHHNTLSVSNMGDLSKKLMATAAVFNLVPQIVKIGFRILPTDTTIQALSLIGQTVGRGHRFDYAHMKPDQTVCFAGNDAQ